MTPKHPSPISPRAGTEAYLGGVGLLLLLPLYAYRVIMQLNLDTLEEIEEEEEEAEHRLFGVSAAFST